ncbi:MAG: efflux RND transporter periplasmic adaptor subunit [Flavobacteriia bacterium]
MTLFKILTSSLFLMLFACSSEQKAPEESSEKAPFKLSAQQIQSMGIELGTLQQTYLGLSVFANGIVDVPPQNKSYIAMPFGGYIKQIKVLDGMQVQKGQVLLVVEHPEIIQLQQEYLLADYERQKQLFEKEAGSAKSYQQAKSAFLVNKAKLSGLSMQLEMANVNINQLKNGQIERTQKICSPFAGVITKVTANVGSFAEPKDNLLEIIDLKHAHAELTVYEKYLSFLQKDQVVHLQFVDEQATAEAKVYLIGREISAERTVKVHCHFEQLPTQITPGSYLKAEIRAENQLQYTLPEEAIVQQNGKEVVFIEQDGNFLPIDVDILITQDGLVAITSKKMSLLKRSQIVCKGAYELLALRNKEVE